MERRGTSIESVATLSTKPQNSHQLFCLYLLVGASPQTPQAKPKDKPPYIASAYERTITIWQNEKER